MTQAHRPTTQQYNMPLLWLFCMVAALGGLLFGYDWVVIGGAKAFYEPFFGITSAPFLQGFAMRYPFTGRPGSGPFFGEFVSRWPIDVDRKHGPDPLAAGRTCRRCTSLRYRPLPCEVDSSPSTN